MLEPLDNTNRQACQQNCWLMLGWILALVCSSGATCIPKRGISEFQPPVVFTAAPSLPEIVEVVNRSSKVYQMQSPAVKVRMADLPLLSASMDWQRERNFRMMGGLSRLTGTDFDIGSNAEIFWMSSRHDVTPTLYYARHDQFESQLNRQVLSVSPLWMVEALGIIQLDATTIIGAPETGPDGMIRIVSTVASPVGAYQRTLHIDPKLGIVRQILLRDPTGRLLANANLSDHQYYAAIGTSLPHKSQVELIPIGGEPLSMQIEIGFYKLNDNVEIDASRFSNPRPEGFQLVDLANLSSGTAATAVQPAYQAALPETQRTDYRGVGPSGQSVVR